MSNRHDRRKATKLGRVQMMTVEEVMQLPSGCAWKGCEEVTHDPDGHGWSKLLLYKGKTRLDFMKISEPDMTRDCVLCPTHARTFDESFLKDIFSRVLDVAGTA